MGRRSGRPVFKEYWRTCRVKNSYRAQKPVLGAFKATTSSRAPSGVIIDSTSSRMAASSVARTTLWPPAAVACSQCALQCGDDHRPFGQ